MKTSEIVIQASNVHISGGAVLLRDVLSACKTEAISTTLFVDERFEVPNQLMNSVSVLKVKSSIFGRLQAEFSLKQKCIDTPKGVFLFFGNLPPLFRSTTKAYLFFQNVILLSDFSDFDFNLRAQIRLKIERLWLKFGIRNIATVFVQSESVKVAFLKDFPNAIVKVLAFSEAHLKSETSELKSGFVYVASGDPHKNHEGLIKAWLYLHDAGVNESLILTAPVYDPVVNQLLIDAKNKGVKIEIRHNLPHSEVLRIYGTVKALIYPSMAESFGLPLLEAKSAGLPIIASERDYVRDLVEPVETFDPNSPISIARAVQRFLKVKESAKTEVKTAADFLQTILSS